MKTTVISSQRFLSEEIVSEKIAAEDYTVMLSPVFDYDGGKYQVVIDGHHSLHAAIAAGVDPVYIVATVQQSDNIALLDGGQVDDYLEASWIDADWYDVETGRNIW